MVPYSDWTLPGLTPAPMEQTLQATVARRESHRSMTGAHVNLRAPLFVSHFTDTPQEASK